jgi:hypothetical protein
VLHLGLALELLTNYRLGWKGLPETNTLAYFAFSALPAGKNRLGCLCLSNELRRFCWGSSHKPFLHKFTHSFL